MKLSVRIAAVACGLVLVASAGRCDDELDEAGNYSASLALESDRDAREALSAAEEDLAAGRTAAGLRRLQELLDRPQNVLIEQGRRHVSLWDAVNWRIGAMPAADRDTYQRLVRESSEREFNAARDPIDLESLSRLTDRYRHTPMGSRSAGLLAALARDRGDQAEAARWGRYLQDHSGESAIPAGIARLLQSNHADSDAHADSERFGPDESNSEVEAWSVDLQVADAAALAIDSAIARLDAQALTPMLTCHPLIADGKIITRTLHGLACVDARTGDRLWEHPISHHASRLARRPGALNDPIRNGQVSAVLLRRLVRDSLQDELASDGESVFTLVTDDRVAGEDPSRPANILRAIDIKTGKLRWELTPDSGRRFFLGPPLANRSELLLPAQRGQQVELVALDPETGEANWSVLIGRAVRDLWPQERSTVAMEAAPEDRERQSTACLLSRQGSKVLFPTASGAIACIDISQQRLLWAHRYPRRDLSTRAPSPGDETYFREMPTRDAFVAAESWILGEVGIGLAPDADRILAHELTTGRLLWSRARGDVIQVLPVDEVLLLVGASGVRALDVGDGTLRWFTATARPAGRAVIRGDSLVLPLMNARFDVLRLSDGSHVPAFTEDNADAITVTTRPPQGPRPISLRNLSRGDGVLICQDPTKLGRIDLTGDRDDESGFSGASLATVLKPITTFRTASAATIDALRRIDARLALLDGAVLHLMAQAGLKQSVEQRAAELLSRLERAEAAGQSDIAADVRKQLASRNPQQLYVTTADDRHTCRLDRWLGLPQGEGETDSATDPDRDPFSPVDTDSPWPHRSPEVTQQRTNFGIAYLHRVPVEVGEGSPWRDITVDVDRQGRLIQFADSHSARPATVMLPREVGIYRLEPAFLHGWAVEDVLIVRIGLEVIAFALGENGELPQTSLWPADNQTLSLQGQRTQLPTSLREEPESTLATWKTTSSGLADVFGREPGDIGPVCRDYFCHQQWGDLVARDMRTGDQLWRRARWPVGTESVGDEDFVVLFHPDRTKVTVLNAADGRTVRAWELNEVLAPRRITPQRPFTPELINGTRAVVVDPHEGRQRVQAIDMAGGAILWQRDVDARATLFAVNQTRLGFVAPGSEPGHYTIVMRDWASGAEVDRFDVPGPQQLQQVLASEGPSRRYLILSGRITDLPLQNVRQIRGGLDRPLVNGWLHALNTGATEVLWSQPLENVAFPLVQPRHVPLLLINDMIQPKEKSVPQGRLLCLDAHTGETLATLQQMTHIYYTLAPDAAAARIDIRLPGQRLRLDYGSAAAAEQQ